MQRYLNEIIKEFREDLIKATTLARVDLFHIDDEKPKVKEIKRQLFHI